MGEALASKTPSRSWFLGETWVLLVSHINSSMALPLSKCVPFLSIFWVPLGKSACFWALLSRPRPLFYRVHRPIPIHQLSSFRNCVAMVSSPLFVFMSFYFFPFSVIAVWFQEELEVNGYVRLLWLPRNFIMHVESGFFLLLAPKGILIWHVISSIFT